MIDLVKYESEMQPILMKALRENDFREAFGILSEDGEVVDANLRDRESGLAPLHYTALNSEVALAMLLYLKGADPNAPDPRGRTPLHLAALKGSLQMVSFLLKANSDPSALDFEKKKPSAYATGAQKHSILELLEVAEQDLDKAKAMISNFKRSQTMPLSPSSMEVLARKRRKLNSRQASAGRLRAIPEEQRTKAQQKELAALEAKIRKKQEEIDILEGTYQPHKARRSWSLFGF